MEAERRTLGQRVWSLHSHGGARLSPGTTALGPQHQQHQQQRSNNDWAASVASWRSSGSRCARCWWHIGRIQHIWLDTKYKKIIKFQPSWCWKDWSFEWRKVQLRKVRLSSLYFMFSWPTIWTRLVGHEKVHDINSQSAIFTSSTKKEPTFCTSCLLPTSYFIVRMFLLWGISLEFGILASNTNKTAIILRGRED